jgi:hypothetical protein
MPTPRDHRAPPLDFVSERLAFLALYFFFACASHLARFFFWEWVFFGSLRQAFSALASFCALVSGCTFVLLGSAPPLGTGWTLLPGPEKTELGGASKLGCPLEPDRHCSVLAHGVGGGGSGVWHGDSAVHTFASYTS